MKSTFAIFVFLVIAVYAGHPAFPEKKACSIEGTGTATLNHWDGDYSGTAVMKRTNGTAIYYLNLTADASGEPYNVTFLFRPDVRKTFFKSSKEEVTFNLCPNVKHYTYTSTLKPIPNRDYYSYSDGTGAMFFSQDEYLDLIGEYFDIDALLIAEKLTIVYDSVEDYVHTEIDDVFSILDYGNDADARTQAPWASSTACDELPSSSIFISSSSSSSSSYGSGSSQTSSSSSSSSSTSTSSSTSSSSSSSGSSSSDNSSAWILPSFATLLVAIAIALLF